MSDDSIDRTLKLAEISSDELCEELLSRHIPGGIVICRLCEVEGGDDEMQSYFHYELGEHDMHFDVAKDLLCEGIHRLYTGDVEDDDEAEDQ